jgi:hypothetical protein
MFNYLNDLHSFDINKRNSKMQTILTLSLIHENFSLSEKLMNMGSIISSYDKRIAFEVL